MKKILYSSLFALIFMACSGVDEPVIDLPTLQADYALFVQRIKTNNATQITTDSTAIVKYLTDNKLTAQLTPEGIFYIVETEGIGSSPNLLSKVSVNYKGYLLDGNIFEKSESPIEIGLLNVITGWTVGLQKFKKGGKGKLLIPSSFAYGKNGQGKIPANTPLIFDVELVDFK